MTVYEALNLLIGFGMLIATLFLAVVAMLSIEKK
ncbi:putative holin-like toxin [Ammoniphilus sp. YIM 78166]|nr:putative holin-like toxin [Ammoniphilus sp. YIM 78166]